MPNHLSYSNASILSCLFCSIDIYLHVTCKLDYTRRCYLSQYYCDPAVVHV